MSKKTIVVTRPSGQAHSLIERLSASFLSEGYLEQDFPQILSLPLLTIVPKTENGIAGQVANALRDADLAIFVSPNAIECTMRLLSQDWQACSAHPIPIGVMGGSSRVALQSLGIGTEKAPTPIYLPLENHHWDSEGLWEVLNSLGWDWPQKKVVIFKGEGGRDWLAQTLKDVGASVELISVYARIPLDGNSPEWESIFQMDFSQSLWLLTSSEAVRYLGKVIQGPLNQTKKTLLYASAICPHQNIGEAAKAIGFGKVFICEPGDEALVKASQVWLSLSSS